MKNILLTVLLMLCFGLEAQIQNAQYSSLSDLQFYVRANNPSYNTAEGSRYLNDEFLPARINGIKNTQLVRFNVPDNIVEVKNNKNEIMGLSFAEGYTIIIQDGSSKTYETYTYNDEDGNKQTSFFEKVHEEGKFKLFVKENIKFTPAKPAKSGYEPAKPAKFTRENSTFYVLGFPTDNQSLTLLPKKRKDFVGLFGEHAPTIEKKIKSEKLKLKDAGDLRKVFKAYFELL